MERLKKYLFKLIPAGLFFFYFFSRLSYLTNNLDQWDVVLYKDTLESLTFIKAAKWPLLLLIQSIIWKIFSTLEPAKILSLTSLFFASGFFSLTYIMCFLLTNKRSYGFIAVFLMYFSPLFALHSIIGMQDMPQSFFLTLSVTFLYLFNRYKLVKFIYLTCLSYGFLIGTRTTYLILLPVIIVYLFKNSRINGLISSFLAIGVFFVATLVWIVPDYFVFKDSLLSSSWEFFIEQVVNFNVIKIGFLKKLSTYTLFTGYEMILFYRLPFVLFLSYIALILSRPKSIYRLILSFMVMLSCVIAIGLFMQFKNASLLKLISYSLILLVVAYCETLKLKRIRFFCLFKSANILDHELTPILLVVTILFLFNYLLTGSVARYFLPLSSLVLSLFVLVISKITKPVNYLFIAVYIFISLRSVQMNVNDLLKNFSRNSDTRTSVSKFALKNSGLYYNAASFGFGIQTYFESYNVKSRLIQLDSIDCTKFKPDSKSYLITYGNLQPQDYTCSNARFLLIKKYQRKEIIIEDSVGNTGFNIYRINRSAKL